MNRYRILVSLGSNLSKGEICVKNALEWMQRKFGQIVCSGIYCTAPLKGTGEPYFNAVAEFATSLPLQTLNEEFKKYEKECGRDNNAREKGIVPIDIDIVLFNDEIIRPTDFRQEYFQNGFKQLKSKKDRIIVSQL